MSVDLIHPALAPGNVAVVTGGASGIGYAAAQRFLGLGLRVCIADSDAGALDQASTRLAQDGEVLCHATDVADRASVAALAETVARKWGAVSVLMNNAGIGGGGDALSNPDRWYRVLGVNLLGVLHGVQTIVPSMVSSNLPGLVINTGSKQGITQPPGDTAYNVSKSGVKSLTEGLAHTLRAQTGERVTAHLLIPGFTYTRIMERHFPERPAGAWSAAQVVDRMMSGLAAREFYILCQDNETTREVDEKRILWAALDIIENRPALSRWHADYKPVFEAFMSARGRPG